MTASILIVDDDPVQRRLIEAAVARFGYRPLLAADGEAALALLESPGSAAAVILDLGMPGLDGLGVLKAMRQRGIERRVIVQTASGGIETVVSAMRNGAFDFVVKPVSPERLRVALEAALKVEAFELAAKRTPGRGIATFKDILASSPGMERAIRMAEKAAAFNIPVLIEGESGVGKELVARAIQAAGDRRDRPFVTVNCGAIPANLVESILFGHVKGSFTGATEKHVGKFVEANGGTLFLDEIGDLPLETQVKLLRAVQDGEIDPIGGRSTVKVDIRLISATHRDLLKDVRDGRFREDLFYRLNVYPIAVPPLRARRADIARLVRHFIARVPSRTNAPAMRSITPDALALLEAYDWPGNIRQLENAILRACVLCEGDMLTVKEFSQIGALLEGGVAMEVPGPPARSFEDGDQPRASGEPGSSGTLRAIDERGNVRPLADLEAELIRLAIEHYGGQMSEVARRLGIGRSTLYRKLRDYGLEPEEARSGRLAS